MRTAGEIPHFDTEGVAAIPGRSSLYRLTGRLSLKARQPGADTPASIRQYRDMVSRILHGRTVVDRTDAAHVAGVALSTLDLLYRTRTTSGFPERVEGSKEWYADEITAWRTDYELVKKAKLTPVDRTGDPGELITTPEVARVLGYKNRESLLNSAEHGIWPKLLDRVDESTTLPSGRVRRKWKRTTVWAIADERTGPAGARPLGTPIRGPVDRSGDPEELVGAAEAARVLGYSHGDRLPAALREQADDLSSNRSRWKRSTLWRWAEENMSDR